MSLRKRAKPGDILELKLDEGFAYLHYLGKHPEYGAAIVVSSLFESPQMPVNAVSSGYVTFYPVTVAVARGLVKIVGHLPPPPLPLRYRRAGARYGNQVVAWIIEDGTQQIVTKKLSNEELRLPIAAIWNHEMLISKVVKGWTPLQEGSTV
jgi:hypothetical protein